MLLKQKNRKIRKNREISLVTASSSKSSHLLSWGMQGSWPPTQRIEDWKNTSSLGFRVQYSSEYITLTIVIVLT